VCAVSVLSAVRVATFHTCSRWMGRAIYSIVARLCGATRTLCGAASLRTSGRPRPAQTYLDGRVIRARPDELVDGDQAEHAARMAAEHAHLMPLRRRCRGVPVPPVATLA
jgi:hypothetical protein